jgi:hypothetical protein
MDILKGEAALTGKSHRPIRNHSAETAGWAVLIVVLFGGLMVSLRPRPEAPRDFFQDYASARNLRSSRPVYTRIDQVIGEYTGGRGTSLLAYNAHPPTSVLLALPFAGMAYVPAAVAWGLLSVALLAGSVAVFLSELRPDLSLSHLVLLSVVLGLWPPLWAHLLEGQLGVPILFLLTLAWRAARHGKDSLAGGLIGFAAAIKIFPAVLIAFFLVRGRFRLAVAATLSLVLVSAATLSITGPGAFRDYVMIVLPNLKHWSEYEGNVSLNGFFSRLLSPYPAGAATWMAAILVAAVVWVRSTRAGFDESFALAITGVLLTAPLTWPHSLVILLLPLAVYGGRLSRADSVSRWLAGAGWLLMAVPQGFFLTNPRAFIPVAAEYKRPSVVVSLTVLSLNFYGLVAFFFAQARLRRTRQFDGSEHRPAPTGQHFAAVERQAGVFS